MADAERRRKLGEAAYRRAQEFSWDAAAEKTLALLRAERGRERPAHARATRPLAGVAAALAARNGVLAPVAVGLLALTLVRVARG
jgi:hypothetical protein